MMIGGGIGFALSVTWGFVRPYLFDKPVTVQKVANVIDRVNIGIMPMSNGNTGLNVSLRHSF